MAAASPHVQGGRNKAGMRTGEHRLADTGYEMQEQGKAHCDAILQLQAGPRRPPALNQERPAEDKAGEPLTHLVGDLKRKQNTQFMERSCLLRAPLPLSAPGRASPAI